MSRYADSERLELRYVTEADVPLLVDLDSDPEVMRFLTDGKSSTEADIRAAVGRTQVMYERFQNKMGLWTAFQKQDQSFIGWFLLRPDKKQPDNLKDLELGYRLKKQFWGMGFATEMSRVLLRKAFSELSADSVFAITMKQNLKSQAVMKKLGMQFQNDYVETDFPGQDKSAVRYQILKSSWGG